MKAKKFLKLVDKLAEKKGFENDILIMVADKNGDLEEVMHIWNKHNKRCEKIKKVWDKLCKDSMNEVL